ncbi:glycoside hydrolase family 32 protein [Ktedonospora formicarum]|uniref:Sucrose-6-phosphate hydrolase n=1 Tax=Ktedonospora formicarum TaxID=2778364 RepID=A0A8J3ICE4_9CHLR|nr:glycoside hydrolase family 32 protein [Ktedonospora formicarum]GHO49534.1 hypothetical protein KSX_76970 [Ktedonospora formicarum]
MTSAYEPYYHFFPRHDFMNDPNGLIYYKGEYHLFYQHLAPKHWGHAVSQDLVHWQILPTAIKPDHLGDIWSGSAVADDANTSGLFDENGGMVAIFTHQNGQQSAPLGPQIQSIAYSKDAGRSWTTYEENPVIPNPNVRDFRDPFVFWHAPTQAWVMVVSNGDHVRIYRSPDLKHWDLASEFGSGHGYPGVIWECPSLFELPVDGDPNTMRWVLHMSVILEQDRAMELPRMQYLIGHFDGYTFTNANPAANVLWSDYGKDHYAAVPWNNIPASDGRLIWLGWCDHWSYASRLPTGDWQGMMTIPRELKLKTLPEGIALLQQPIEELKQLRAESFTLPRQELAAGNHALPIQGSAIEVVATFEAGTATEFGLSVRVGTDQQTIVGYDTTRAEVFVDRTRSGESAFHELFAGRHSAPLVLHDATLTLHIFVDTSSIEVFANDGERVISDLIFPNPTSQGLSLYARNGAVTLLSLVVYRLH